MTQEIVNVYFDGGTVGKNPGKIKTSFIIEYTNSKKTPEIFTEEYDVIGSNNEAEWLSVLSALVECENKKFKKINFFGDSNMVINVINGIYTQRKEKLRKFFLEFCEQEERMSEVEMTFEWVPRKENKSGWAISESKGEQQKLKNYMKNFLKTSTV